MPFTMNMTVFGYDITPQLLINGIFAGAIWLLLTNSPILGYESTLISSGIQTLQEYKSYITPIQWIMIVITLYIAYLVIARRKL